MKSASTSVWVQGWRLSCSSVREHLRLLWISALVLLCALLYPTDLSEYRDPAPMKRWSVAWSSGQEHKTQSLHDGLTAAADWVEHKGRFLSTGVQVLLPLVLGDRVGLVQLFYSGVATTTVTHGLKRGVDGWQVGPSRLGERPNGGRHNMPSGHSSMAASALGFIWRRYGAWHLVYLLPLLLATMTTRVLLSAHTWPAVFAGALIGVVVTYMMTTPRRMGGVTH